MVASRYTFLVLFAAMSIGAQGLPQKSLKHSNPPARATVEDEFLIVPGKRVGRIALQAPIPSPVMAALGKPDKWEKTPAGPGGIYTWNKILQVWVGGSQAKVTSIEVNGGKYHTKVGIQIGSTLAEVKTAYAKQKMNTGGGIGNAGPVITLDWPGISLSIDRATNKVSSIIVMSKEEEND